MTTSFDPAPAARLLADAMNAGRRFAELPEAARPQTLGQGYDVQDLIAGQLADDGMLQDRTAGWKLGLGSANAMRAAGLQRPLIGRIFAGRLHANGAEIAAPAGASAMIEIEIAFTFGRDVLPDDTVANPLDVVARTNLASEIVLSRFVDRTSVGLPSFAADSVGFHALVMGPEVEPGQIDAISASLNVAHDGAHKVGAQMGDDAIDPVEMVGHLMAHARERGITIRSGEVVTTGTLSTPFDATVPSAVEAKTVAGAVSFRLIASG